MSFLADLGPLGWMIVGFIILLILNTKSIQQSHRRDEAIAICLMNLSLKAVELGLFEVSDLKEIGIIECVRKTAHRESTENIADVIVNIMEKI